MTDLITEMIAEMNREHEQKLAGGQTLREAAIDVLASYDAYAKFFYSDGTPTLTGEFVGMSERQVTWLSLERLRVALAASGEDNSTL